MFYMGWGEFCHAFYTVMLNLFEKSVGFTCSEFISVPKICCSNETSDFCISAKFQHF